MAGPLCSAWTNSVAAPGGLTELGGIIGADDVARRR